MTGPNQRERTNGRPTYCHISPGDGWRERRRRIKRSGDVEHGNAAAAAEPSNLNKTGPGAVRAHAGGWTARCHRRWSAASASENVRLAAPGDADENQNWNVCLPPVCRITRSIHWRIHSTTDYYIAAAVSAFVAGDERRGQGTCCPGIYGFTAIPSTLACLIRFINFFSSERDESRVREGGRGSEADL